MLTVVMADRREICVIGCAKIFEGHPLIKPIAVCETTIEKIIESVCEHRPDVVIFDVGYNGVEPLRRIHERLPETHLIAITDHQTYNECCSAFQAGARAYLSKEDFKIDTKVEIITLVADGKVVLSPRIVAQMPVGIIRSEPTYRKKRMPVGALSQRESAVLALVAQGLSNGEIGAALSISAHTVKVHLRNIMDKLGAHTRLQAVSLAGVGTPVHDYIN